MGRKEILDILLAVKGKVTVVFSTHILADVERICDHVAVLNNGGLALWGTLSELKAKRKADSLLIEFAAQADRERFIALYGMTNCTRTETGVIIRTDNITAAQARVFELLAGERLLLRRLEIAEPTIENLFLEAIQ